jgi:hypothetical protein
MRFGPAGFRQIVAVYGTIVVLVAIPPLTSCRVAPNSREAEFGVLHEAHCFYQRVRRLSAPRTWEHVPLRPQNRVP